MNFDFSVVKWDAPKEFQDVGKCLSTKRKKEAEDGPLHTVVRKLSVLFAQDGDLPEVPHLINAYGKRASAISRNPELNPKGSLDFGPFAENIGADATSIWAAATSGPGAIAVHLLACMLAYIFRVPEAISIWTELVAIRKGILDERIQGEEYRMSEITASHIRVDRKDLASWDASTRYFIPDILTGA